MRKDQHIAKILQRFPTERYKQFSHQTRPFLTMAMAVFLITLGWLQIVNFVVIAWVLAAFVLDNVALTPIMSALRAINHLNNGRKQFKSMVILAVVVLALLAGTGLGYFVLLHTPAVTSFFANYIALTACSPFMISMGAMAGAYFSHSTHKVSLFWGIFIGSCLASILPIPIPIAFEVVYFSAVAIAFFATVIAKQSLRLYYKLYYDHTNADGYNVAKNPTEIREFAITQAHKFGVSAPQFTALTEQCRSRIEETKRDASFWAEYMNYRSNTTNSYKDIYFALMNPTISAEDITEMKHVIANSNLPAAVNTTENRKKVATMSRLGTFFSPDVELRTLAHQFHINEPGVLDANLLKAFQPHPTTPFRA
jgi:hypothetical protein